MAIRQRSPIYDTCFQKWQVWPTVTWDSETCRGSARYSSCQVMPASIIRTPDPQDAQDETHFDELHVRSPVTSEVDLSTESSVAEDY